MHREHPPHLPRPHAETGPQHPPQAGLRRRRAMAASVEGREGIGGRGQGLCAGGQFLSYSALRHPHSFVFPSFRRPFPLFISGDQILWTNQANQANPWFLLSSHKPPTLFLYPPYPLLAPPSDHRFWQANAFSSNWGTVIFQSANEMANNDMLKKRLEVIFSTLPEEKKDWEARQQSIREVFMKELEGEGGPKTAGSARPSSSAAPPDDVAERSKESMAKGSSDEDAVIVDHGGDSAVASNTGGASSGVGGGGGGGGGAGGGGKGKKKKGKR